MLIVTGKKYTLILKDELLPPSPNGREQSTTSYEYDFVVPEMGALESGSNAVQRIPWSSFKPTYRGKPKLDAPPLDTEHIKQISLMVRRSVENRSLQPDESTC